MISVNMVGAVKVQFLKQLCEENFPEKGMLAWLTDVEWDEGYDCYKLFFDFTEFEQQNDKYFKAVFYSNRHTEQLARETGRVMFTAKESGDYEPKYSVYFSAGNAIDRDDALFEQEIQKYLRAV